MPASRLPLIAVVRHTRLPHTTGLESPRPGRGAFHATLLPSPTLQVVAVGCPSATPLAAMPRNCGQSRPGFAGFAADTVDGTRTAANAVATRTSASRLGRPCMPRFSHGGFVANIFRGREYNRPACFTALAAGRPR